MAQGEDQAPAEAAPDETEGTDELGVLFPDFDVEVRDPETGDAVTLTVREFRFLEGLEVQSEARPLIRELAGLVECAANGAEVGLIELNAAIGAHGALWLSLIARACGREVSWLAGLADADAHALHAAMWAVHGPFFTRRLVAAAAVDERVAKMWRSFASSTSSSAPGTAEMTGTEASASGSPGGTSSSSGKRRRNAGPRRSPAA